jgi:hypothetical protein
MNVTKVIGSMVNRRTIHVLFIMHHGKHTDERRINGKKTKTKQNNKIIMAVEWHLLSSHRDRTARIRPGPGTKYNLGNPFHIPGAPKKSTPV